MFSGVEVTLGNNKEFYGLSSESVFMQCVLSSGNFDQLPQRKWLANGDILISNGVLSSAGSGYMEILGTDRFGLKTPKLNNNFNGTNYICSYGFDQSSLYMRIAGKCKSYSLNHLSYLGDLIAIIVFPECAFFSSVCCEAAVKKKERVGPLNVLF